MVPMTTTRTAEEIPPWLYTLLVVAGQVIGLSLIIAIGSRDAGYAGLGAYAFAAGFGALLLLRRRFPLAVLVVTVFGIFAYYAFGYPPIGMAVPAVAALYATSVRGRAPAALAAGFVLLAVSLYFRVRDQESSAVLAYDVLTNAALVGCAVALGLNVRGRQRLRAQQETIVALERSREQERAARDLQAERVRIARDLHDSVGHALSVISVHAHVAREAQDRAAATGALDRIIDATGTSLRDLRTTLSLLRGPGDGDGRTPPTLDGIDRLLQAARDVGLDVHATLTTEPVPSPVASAAFRIVQEAVTNVLRHASATTLTVEVTADADTLHVRVADDGHGTADPHDGPAPAPGATGSASAHGAAGPAHGAPGTAGPASAHGAPGAATRAGDGRAESEPGPGRPEPGPGDARTGRPRTDRPRTGRGIAGMRERARALGGTFSAGDADGGGFAVTAELPLGGAA